MHSNWKCSVTQRKQRWQQPELIKLSICIIQLWTCLYYSRVLRLFCTTICILASFDFIPVLSSHYVILHSTHLQIGDIRTFSDVYSMFIAVFFFCSKPHTHTQQRDRDQSNPQIENQTSALTIMCGIAIHITVNVSCLSVKLEFTAFSNFAIEVLTK